MLLTPRTILQSVIRRNYIRPNMPMTGGALKMMQSSRKAKRARQGTSVPSNVYFQVIGNGAPGCSKSVYLHTDHNRYLFNCGEMSQKVITEYVGSNSLSQMTNIFVTSKTWNNIGGLPGLCLSIRAAGSPDVRLHGPMGIMKMYDATEKFVILFDFNVIYHNPEKEALFEDSAVTVHHVALKPDDDKPFISREPKYCKWLPDMDFTSKGVSGGAEHEIDPTVYAYVVTVKGRPGKINMEKCAAFGIRPGPIIGMLKNGHQVKLENGKIVKSEDVTEDPEGPSTYLVIDCPSVDYVPNLLKEPLLQANELPHLCGIFHVSPLNVVNSERYVHWVDSLPDDITHVMLNQNSYDFGTTKLLLQNAKLHMVAPQVFSKMLPGEPSKKKEIESKDAENNDYKDWSRKCVQGVTDMRFFCRPNKGSITWNQVDPMELFEEETKVMQPELDNVLKTTQEAIEKALEECPSKDISYPKVTFLGTGSSVPSKYRNASCILVEVVPDSYIILDCGEGSLNQLVRLHGFQKARKVLRNLKAIYISHLHADHHLGLINLILEREKSFAELNEEPSKVYIMAPARIANYLSIYHQNFQPILTDLEHVRNEHLLISDKSALKNSNSNNGTNLERLCSDTMQKMLEHVQLKSVKTCRVFHCPSAFAVSLTTLDGYKIVYSGDTRPTENLITLGQDEEPTDLLIHEATMEHHMLEDAQVKRHTTFTEAVEVTREMKAKNAIMTHFSQRYSKIPLLDEFEVADNVGIAFDFTTVTPSTVDVIRQTYPALKILFKEAIEDVLSKKDVFKFKRIDQAIEASLNMEKSFGDEPDETEIRPKKARISDEVKQRKVQKSDEFSKRYARDSK